MDNDGHLPPKDLLAASKKKKKQPNKKKQQQNGDDEDYLPEKDYKARKIKKELWWKDVAPLKNKAVKDLQKRLKAKAADIEKAITEKEAALTVARQYAEKMMTA